MNGRMRAYLADKRFWKAICEDCLAKSVGRKKALGRSRDLGHSFSLYGPTKAGE